MTTQTIDKKAKLLGGSVLFSGLSLKELKDLAANTRFVQLEAEQPIFFKGDPGNQLFVVSRGVVRISNVSADGKEATLNLLHAGQIFGEVAVMDGRDRTANALAHEAAELLVIERRDFIGFLGRHPEITLKILTTVCDRLRWVSDLLDDASFLDLPRRLAKRIKLLAEAFGQVHSEGGTRVAVRLYQKDLANLMGVTRESINRQFRLWESEGLVVLDKGYIVIKDESRLEAINEEYHV